MVPIALLDTYSSLFNKRAKITLVTLSSCPLLILHELHKRISCDVSVIAKEQITRYQGKRTD